MSSIVGEQPLEPDTDDGMVLSKQQPDHRGTSIVTRVPCCGRDSTNIGCTTGTGPTGMRSGWPSILESTVVGRKSD
jgi:hypothetical protein